MREEEETERACGDLSGILRVSDRATKPGNQPGTMKTDTTPTTPPAALRGDRDSASDEPAGSRQYCRRSAPGPGTTCGDLPFSAPTGPSAGTAASAGRSSAEIEHRAAAFWSESCCRMAPRAGTTRTNLLGRGATPGPPRGLIQVMPGAQEPPRKARPRGGEAAARAVS